MIARTLKSRAALLLPLAASACFSRPLPPRLPAEELPRLTQPPGTPLAAHLECVQSGGQFEQPCEQAIVEVGKLLALSGWFSTLEASREDAALMITVYAPMRRPYWSTPPHSPALLLLSPVIPFWWSEPFGHRMTARRTASGEEAEIDTTWEGTTVMWGLAPVLNLSPNRSFRSDPERELHLVQLQLLPLVAGSR